MDRSEKLRLSAGEEYGYGFKQGLFVRMYEHSLYWVATHIKPLKPMLERVKGGEPVIYGGMPLKSFEGLMRDGKLRGVDIEEVTFRWQYASQPNGGHENFIDYAAWREKAMATAEIPPNATAKGRDILREIRAFNLAGSTPIQTMSAVSDWQEYLRNREGAE